MFQTILTITAVSSQFSSYDLDHEYADLESAEMDPNLFDLLLPTNTRQSSPYEDEDAPGASVGVSKVKPSFGVSVGAGFPVLRPKLQILGLIEAFLKLKAKLITSFQAIVNNNYDLIKAVFNLVTSKAAGLQVILLNGITVLRKIIEFALYLFSDLNVGVSSTVSLGAPHHGYGLPFSK